METEGKVENLETIWKKKDGSPIYISENSIAVRDKNGKVVYYEGSVEDISKRKNAQTELEMQKAYFQELFDGSPEPILVVDPYDEIQLMNNAFTELFGYEQEDVSGRKLSDLIIPPGFENESFDFNRRVAKGETIKEITKRLSKSGQIIDVSLIGTPIRLEGRMIGFYVIYQDIKERLLAEAALKKARDEAIEVNDQLQQENLLRKNMQKELEDANKALIDFNKKLKEADRLKSEFISILSHDIGTPITIIQGNMEMLSMGILGELNEKQRTTISSMEENLENLKKLRSDTLDLSRMDMGTLILEKEPVLINQLIGSVVRDMNIIASKHDQSIEMEIVEADIVHCDRDKIRQVLENYLSNAIRYGRIGSKITISGTKEDGFLKVWVKDQGRGIPEDELEKVFESFYRTGDRVNGSTGLGLSIVRGIIDAHGGRTWAESEGPNKGSTFYFTLPCK
jgi:PAS domain S-box-containing protein